MATKTHSKQTKPTPATATTTPLASSSRRRPTRVPTKPAKNRLTPIAETMQTIHGYPKTLVIYKSSASRFFWTRFYYNGKYRIKTTKCISPKDAKAFAIDFYKETLISAVISNTSDKRKSFEVIASRFFSSTEKNSNEKTYRTDFNRYKQHILPEFKQQDIDTITNAQISQFVERLHKAELKPATIKHHIVVLRKIMRFAVANDLMKNLPVFPRITGRLQTQEKRDYLTVKEYDHLVKTCDSLIEKRISVRGHQLTPELKYLIQFMVNSFIRPSDLRVLKHKNIVPKTKNKQSWLELNHEATKTNSHPVQAMPASVHIYRRLLQYKSKAAQPITPDDYVFFPDYKNRNTAMEIIGRLFKEVVTESELNRSSRKTITLYSLRHTAIMLRLILGNVDTLALARNARTSQAMIDKFYAAHLTTDQVREQLHAFSKADTPSPKSTPKKPQSAN
jgi:site-specific recombinase XerD